MNSYYTVTAHHPVERYRQEMPMLVRVQQDRHSGGFYADAGKLGMGKTYKSAAAAVTELVRDHGYTRIVIKAEEPFDDALQDEADREAMARACRVGGGAGMTKKFKRGQIVTIGVAGVHSRFQAKIIRKDPWLDWWIVKEIPADAERSAFLKRQPRSITGFCVHESQMEAAS